MVLTVTPLDFSLRITIIAFPKTFILFYLYFHTNFFQKILSGFYGLILFFLFFFCFIFQLTPFIFVFLRFCRLVSRTWWKDFSSSVLTEESGVDERCCLSSHRCSGYSHGGEVSSVRVRVRDVSVVVGVRGLSVFHRFWIKALPCFTSQLSRPFYANFIYCHLCKHASSPSPLSPPYPLTSRSVPFRELEPDHYSVWHAWAVTNYDQLKKLGTYSA